MNDISIQNVTEFTRVLSEFERRHVAQWFYRGHSDSEYNLVPGLYRLAKVKDESFSDWDELEEYLIKAFEREAIQYLDHPTEDNLDLLVLAQHHRLPTRLLDWTTNPLIALFFAVESNFDLNSDVWCMGFPSTNNCLPEGTFFSQRKDLIKSNFILFPRHIDKRIVNQSGCFTVHDNDTPLNEQEKYKEFLSFQRIKIACEYKKRIKSELYDMGIHESFIYPSLDSLASRIKYELTEIHYRHTCLKE